MPGAQGRECRQKNVEASFRYFGEKAVSLYLNTI